MLWGEVANRLETISVNRSIYSSGKNLIEHRFSSKKNLAQEYQPCPGFLNVTSACSPNDWQLEKTCRFTASPSYLYTVIKQIFIKIY